MNDTDGRPVRHVGQPAQATQPGGGLLALFSPASPDRWLTVALLMFLCLLYIPFAGNYGLWDPWETHYGEVARQMVERNDWISLWWPGSPQDAATFWSKPVLTFWLMALSMKLFGLGHPGVAHAAEMTVGWRAEWALRLPFVLLGIAGVWSVWLLVRRLVGRGAAFWSAAILATCTQWALISRQAMTDMAFVAPMTVGLVFAALALLMPQDEMRRALPRKQGRVLGHVISWPHDRAFYWVFGLYLLWAVPQLLVDCIQLKTWTFAVGSRSWRTLGFIPMLPFVALFLLSLPWMAAARDRRSIYLWVAYITGGIATLGKGPAGIALPVIIIFFYILCSGRWDEFLGSKRDKPWFWGKILPKPLRFLSEYDGGLEVVRGSLIFFVIGAPWYAAMLVRHGIPFWMEMIGDNYVHRAQGRHGDRGTYEYYLRQIALGMFPWSGVVMAAVMVAGRWLRRWSGGRRGLVLFCVVWFLIDFIVVALVNTKFHHYILPALPALAILAGLLVDELCQGLPSLPLDSVVALSLVGLPLTWLSGRDLANFPARIGWLFNYDYVNAPGGGRPWPLVSIYGERYEYGPQALLLVALGTAATALLCFVLGRYLPPGRAGDVDLSNSDGAVGATAPAASGLGSGWAIVGGLLFLGLLVTGILIAPSLDTVTFWSSSKLPPTTELPRWLRLDYLLVAGGAAAWLLGVLWLAGQRGQAIWPARRRRVAWAGMLLLLSGIVWNCWVLDRFMIDISPHWSQKGVFAAYYRLRQGPEEPVVAWQMYWRGENFYTRNDIYNQTDPAERTVFLQDRRTEKAQAYFKTHRNRRIFFLLERSQLETVRALLPAEARPSLHVVDESNNKVYLAMAQL